MITGGITLKQELIVWSGLGHFGLPMATRLLRSGANIKALTNEEHPGGLDEFLAAGGSATTVVEGDFIWCVCLPRASDVQDLYSYRSDLSPCVFMDFTTCSVRDNLGLSAMVSSRGGKYIDVPVSGSIAKALSGDLTIFAGAENNADEVDQILRWLAKRIFYGGEVGEGTKLKLANQLMHLSIMAAIRDLCVYCDANNLSKQQAFDAIQSSSGANEMLRRFGVSILEGNISPQFKLDSAVKDCGLVADAMPEEVSSCLADGVLDIYRRAKDRFGGEVNFTAVCNYQEPHSFA